MVENILDTKLKISGQVLCYYNKVIFRCFLYFVLLFLCLNISQLIGDQPGFKKKKSMTLCSLLLRNQTNEGNVNAFNII